VSTDGARTHRTPLPDVDGDYAEVTRDDDGVPRISAFYSIGTPGAGTAGGYSARIEDPADRRALAAALLDGADLSGRFAPGDYVTVADGPRVGEYVTYLGGPFHQHRVRMVWPDGTRELGGGQYDDARVEPADPDVLAEYGITVEAPRAR